MFDGWRGRGGVARSRTVCIENRLLSLIRRGVSAFLPFSSSHTEFSFIVMSRSIAVSKIPLIFGLAIG